ncbi:MAG: carboxypeptidase-like regulatory domain-containing protein, partial [bacterium]
MRYVIIVCLCVLVGLLGTMPALAAGGTVKGKVTDEQGEGIPLAQVLIEGTTMGDAADDNGEYMIENVPPGTYTLRTRVIGYRVVTAEVTVHADETVTQDFSLVVDPLMLGEVVTTGTRTPRMKLETPLAVSTLSPKVVDQAAPRSTTEVLRYVPGFTRVESSGGEVNQNI